MGLGALPCLSRGLQMDFKGNHDESLQELPVKVDFSTDLKPQNIQSHRGPLLKVRCLRKGAHSVVCYQTIHKNMYYVMYKHTP